MNLFFVSADVRPCPLGRCSVPAAARAGKREMSFLQPKSVGKPRNGGRSG